MDKGRVQMPNIQLSHIDLECGGGSSTREVAEEGSACSSDAEEDSCNSRFYSTADGGGSHDDCSFACGSEILEDEGSESRRASSAADPSDFSDLESCEKKSRLGNVERDCRICHLSLVSSSPGCGIAIELGCSCKDDLAAAHKHCAETWFKIKGNTTCEICNSVACNIVGPNQANDNTAVSAPAPSTFETRTCLNGHRFLNFLLACMVFAFVISWLFHFNIPS